MARGLNICSFIGYLGKDPEVSYTPSGTAVASASIAVTESWKDQDGNKQERTEWVNLVFWKKLAEIAGEYLHKGSRVFVEGKMQTRSWDDKNTGQKRYKTEINVRTMLMLDSRNASDGPPREAVLTVDPSLAEAEQAVPDDLPF